MSKNLKLSVVIPTLDRPYDLVEAVRSILDQSLLPYELIIVDQSIDSKSNNEVKDLFSKLKPTTKLIYIHDKSIKGLVSAKNHAVKNSNGEIISFLEDDVFLDKNWSTKGIKFYPTLDSLPDNLRSTIKEGDKPFRFKRKSGGGGAIQKSATSMMGSSLIGVKGRKTISETLRDLLM